MDILAAAIRRPSGIENKRVSINMPTVAASPDESCFIICVMLIFLTFGELPVFSGASIELVPLSVFAPPGTGTLPPSTYVISSVLRQALSSSPH